MSAVGGRVVLRVEDHDRQRCRPEFEAALLDDLDWLGLRPDEPSTDSLRDGPSAYRQSDSRSAYTAALDMLAARDLVYRCQCSRATFARWAADHGHLWTGPGCPLDCRRRRLESRPGTGLRVVLGDGSESWTDALLGETSGDASPDGDLLAVDGQGNWTYHFAVVVDDIRHDIGLVIRGQDLLESTARQIRLARVLGRPEPPRFLHHGLILKGDGSKLSKADRDTSIQDLRAAGAKPDELLGRAAAAVGLGDGGPISSSDLGRFFA